MQFYFPNSPRHVSYLINLLFWHWFKFLSFFASLSAWFQKLYQVLLARCPVKPKVFDIFFLLSSEVKKKHTKKPLKLWEKIWTLEGAKIILSQSVAIQWWDWFIVMFVNSKSNFFLSSFFFFRVPYAIQ